MSALANTSLANRANQNLARNNGLDVKVSGISVTTRIDYNLRFTKQAVLVVANDAEQYSQLASQFLVSLSSGHPEEDTKQINVAFVSASIKLNDIQIRCRLIEQLFMNTLFDPEQSLAASILKLAKAHGEDISIVVDHAHGLSLQVKYELSQLVSLAKKHKLVINVVLFGLTEAAQQLSTNKALFKNKMTIIDAETGQVLSFDDNKFQLEKPQIALTIWHKLSLLMVLFVLVGILIWGYQLLTSELSKQELEENSITVSTKPIKTVFQPTQLKESSNEQVARLLQKKKKNRTLKDEIKLKDNKIASSEEINLAILALPIVNEVKKIPAQANDVLRALSSKQSTPVLKGERYSVNDDTVRQSTSHVEGTVVKAQKISNQVVIENLAQINHNYFQNQAVVHEQGYVIQIAGFTEHALWRRFIEHHGSENLYSYQKLHEEKTFIVVTSKVYPNKSLAQAAIRSLPASLGVRKPWLKDISSLINEINTFKG